MRLLVFHFINDVSDSRLCVDSPFTKEELCDLFLLADPTKSQTQILLSCRHLSTDTSLDGHIAFLHTLSTFTIVSCVTSAFVVTFSHSV